MKSSTLKRKGENEVHALGKGGVQQPVRHDRAGNPQACTGRHGPPLQPHGSNGQGGAGSASHSRSAMTHFGLPPATQSQGTKISATTCAHPNGICISISSLVRREQPDRSSPSYARSRSFPASRRGSKRTGLVCLKAAGDHNICLIR
jgi:hypothetical protein